MKTQKELRKKMPLKTSRITLNKQRIGCTKKARTPLNRHTKTSWSHSMRKWMFFKCGRQSSCRWRPRKRRKEDLWNSKTCKEGSTHNRVSLTLNIHRTETQTREFRDKSQSFTRAKDRILDTHIKIIWIIDHNQKKVVEDTLLPQTMGIPDHHMQTLSSLSQADPQCLKDLQEAIREDPKCPMIHLLDLESHLSSTIPCLGGRKVT